ncbi:hypothetical protein [Nostoc sp. WHI]|uniref:hypothetical protein n=1 Tax=Nostoc sp. WHI TaxID=2650611 RepID=UPI0018C660D8|nr:hypothetical protein [Nostoc sp. WHI]
MAGYQIVNTSPKAAKDFYSRIEGLSGFKDSVLLKFKPYGSLRSNHPSGAAIKT